MTASNVELSVGAGPIHRWLRPARRVAKGAGRFRRAIPPIFAALAALTALPSVPRADEAAVRFAIFPSQSVVPCFEDIDWMYVGRIAKHLADRKDAELSYSYFAKGSDKTLVPPVHELWNTHVAPQAPVMEAVRAAARKMQIDAVIMAWTRCSQFPTFPANLYRVEMYVIDVERGRVYHENVQSSWSGEAARKGIDEVLAERAAASRS